MMTKQAIDNLNNTETNRYICVRTVIQMPNTVSCVTGHTQQRKTQLIVLLTVKCPHTLYISPLVNKHTLFPNKS